MRMSRSLYWALTLPVGLLGGGAAFALLATGQPNSAAIGFVILGLTGLYYFIAMYARLKDIGLVTWLAVMLTLLRVPVLIFIAPVDIVIAIVIGCIPTGFARSMRIAEA